MSSSVQKHFCQQHSNFVLRNDEITVSIIDLYTIANYGTAFTGLIVADGGGGGSGGSGGGGGGNGGGGGEIRKIERPVNEIKPSASRLIPTQADFEQAQSNGVFRQSATPNGLKKIEITGKEGIKGEDPWANQSSGRSSTKVADNDKTSNSASKATGKERAADDWTNTQAGDRQNNESQVIRNTKTEERTSRATENGAIENKFTRKTGSNNAGNSIGENTNSAGKTTSIIDKDNGRSTNITQVETVNTGSSIGASTAGAGQYSVDIGAESKVILARTNASNVGNTISESTVGARQYSMDSGARPDVVIAQMRSNNAGNAISESIVRAGQYSVDIGVGSRVILARTNASNVGNTISESTVGTRQYSMDSGARPDIAIAQMKSSNAGNAISESTVGAGQYSMDNGASPDIAIAQMRSNNAGNAVGESTLDNQTEQSSLPDSLAANESAPVNPKTDVPSVNQASNPNSAEPVKIADTSASSDNQQSDSAKSQVGEKNSSSQTLVASNDNVQGSKQIAEKPDARDSQPPRQREGRTFDEAFAELVASTRSKTPNLLDQGGVINTSIIPGSILPNARVAPEALVFARDNNAVPGVLPNSFGLPVSRLAAVSDNKLAFQGQEATRSLASVPQGDAKSSNLLDSGRGLQRLDLSRTTFQSGSQGLQGLTGLLALVQGQGALKPVDETGKLIVGKMGNLLAPELIAGIATGKKGIKDPDESTSISLMPLRGIRKSEQGDADEDDEDVLEPDDTVVNASTANLIIANVVSAKASTGTATQTSTSNTDPQPANQSKKPGATDIDSLMEQFPKADALLPPAPRKEIVYDFDDNGPTGRVKSPVDNSYGTRTIYADIDPRVPVSRGGGSAATPNTGFTFGQIVGLILDTMKAKKPVNKSGFAILFDAMWNFNDHKQYKTRKGDTWGSIAAWQHKDENLGWRLYQENVGRGIIKPIKNARDFDAIKDIKVKPGTELVLLSCSNIFHHKRANQDRFLNPTKQLFNTSAQMDETDDVMTESVISAFDYTETVAVPAPKAALKAMMSANNLQASIPVKKAFKSLEIYLTKQGYITENTTTLGRSLNSTAKVFKLRDYHLQKIAA